MGSLDEELRHRTNKCLNNGNSESDRLVIYILQERKVSVFVFVLANPFTLFSYQHILGHIHFKTHFYKFLLILHEEKWHQVVVVVVFSKLPSPCNVKGKHSLQCIPLNLTSITQNNTQCSFHFKSIALLFLLDLNFIYLVGPSLLSETGTLLSIRQQHF